jgi:hypothetical protein
MTDYMTLNQWKVDARRERTVSLADGSRAATVRQVGNG